MSEWRVQVIRLGKVGKHPNADTLSITQCNGYPVCFKTGAFEAGGLAIHVCVDSVVDTRLPWFAWLAPQAKADGTFRVRAAKLRNVPSYGFLVPLSEIPGAEAFTGGQLVHAQLGVTKYDDGSDTPGPGCVDGPGVHIPHYDIEGLRKYQSLFTPGEEVSVTEKIHGSNGRWTWSNGRLHAGSRTKWRENSVWNQVAERYGLEKVLSSFENQGLVLFGEVFGHGAQDLDYGQLPGEPALRLFDIYDAEKGYWWPVQSFFDFCSMYGLPAVPELYRGPFNLEQLIDMAEGGTTFLAQHVREGIVVKPMTERHDLEVGRVFLKLPGQGYLLRKQK